MSMDINVIREIVTVVSFVTFVGIVAWTVDPRRKSRFEQAAQAPLEDE
jgi:cytochrome c oxidase cbb3-type subunit IV